MFILTDPSDRVPGAMISVGGGCKAVLCFSRHTEGGVIHQGRVFGTTEEIQVPSAGM